MSANKGQNILFWKLVEEHLQRSNFTYHDKTLSPENQITLTNGLLLCVVVWDELLSSVGISFQWKRWLNAIATAGIEIWIDALKAADQFLISSAQTMSETWETFKQSCNQSCPRSGAILAPLHEVMSRWFTLREPQDFAICHQLLAFPSRLHFVGIQELEQGALDKYLDCELHLQQNGFTVEESSWLTDLLPRTLLFDMYEGFCPRHGSGGVADKTGTMPQSIETKYQLFGEDVWTHYLDLRISSEWQGPRYLSQRWGLPVSGKIPQSRQARLVFVPKSMQSYRSISMEPAHLMWYQQGFFRSLCRILSDRGLGRRWRPEDQSPNRDLAWEGSIDGSFSTIDLSAASDSVSWALVRSWFRGTCLYPVLAATRSTSVQLPTGETLHMKKFAPMGSALNFPVEVLVFCAITECAIKEVGGDPVTSRYRVYGDDIVVETKYVQAVMDRLKRNGFCVNYQKSFFNQDSPNYFRESCGAEFLDGVDVEPIRLSRWFSGWADLAQRPQRILSLVQLANAFVGKLTKARLLIIWKLQQNLPSDKQVPFSEDGESGLFSTQPTNFHLGTPWYDPDYQVSFHHCGCVRMNRSSNGDDETTRLYEWFRQTDGRKNLTWPEDRVEVSVSANRRPTWSRGRVEER